MSFDGPPDDPRTRPLPQRPPSPYGRPGDDHPAYDQPAGGQPYPATTPYGQPVESQPAGPYAERPYAEPTQAYGQPARAYGQPTQPYAPVQAPPGRGGPPSPPSPQPPPSGRRRGRRSPVVIVPAVIGTLLVLGAAAAFVVIKLRGPEIQDAPSGTPTATGRAAAMPPGRTWLSGAWTGGLLSASGIEGFGSWRGQAADVVTTYPAYDTWAQLKDSDYFVGTFDGFKGRLSYGLPLLPKHDSGSLSDVAAGKYDDVWTAIAGILNKHDRGDSYVRIGLEANGDWFPWGSDASHAADFKAAYRHVESVMKAVSPKLVFSFDITCGHPLGGGSNRLDSLNALYPGDDAVDVVGCDDYDSYSMKARNADEWQHTLRPDDAVGLDDVAEFARAHGKKMAVPEWGLTATGGGGSGDNPFFIYSMYQFFLQNKDVLAYEDYFNEPAPPPTYVGSALWGSDQNPRSAAEYRKLWGAAPHLSADSG